MGSLAGALAFIPAAASGTSAAARRSGPESMNPASAAEAGRPVTFAIARSTGEMAELRHEWNELYLSSEAANPFLSYDWTLACHDTAEQQLSIFVATLRIDGRLVAIAPLCISRRRGFRVLRFIADERSDYLGFLCSPEPAGLEQLLLRRLLELRSEWDIALLRPLAAPYSALQRSTLLSGYLSCLTRWTSAPFGTWEDDWQALQQHGPSWLREMAKRRRRFLRDGYSACSYRGADAAARLDLISQIEERSWKGRLGTTRFQPGLGRALLARALESLRGRGELQLWIAYAGEQAIAFQLDFVLPDRLWHYQGAYDEAFASSRAGSVLAYLALESAWESGIRTFDYLAGEEPYKLSRTNASRPIYHLAIYPATAKGRLAFLALFAARWRLRKVAALRRFYDALRSAKSKLRIRHPQRQGGRS